MPQPARAARVSPADPPIRPQYWIAWLVLLLGVGLSILLWHAARSSSQEQAYSRFHSRADELQTAIESRLTAYAQALRGVQATIGATGHPDRASWERLAQTLAIEQTYPGIVGIVYIRDVPASEVDSVLAEGRRSHDTFSIKPPGERDHYAIVTAVEPRTASNLKVLGADSWSHDERRRTLEAARDYGDTRITGKLTLVIDTEPEPQPGFLMYRPIYRGGVTPETLAARRKALLGYVAIGFRIPALVEGTLGKPADDIAVRIYDSAVPNPLYEFYSSHPQQSSNVATHTRNATVSISGRLWSLHFSSLRRFDIESGTPHLNRLLFGGLFISALLFAIAWSLLGTRAHAMRLAQGMTRTLRTNESKLRALFEQAPIAVWTVDRNGIILECNRKLSEMIGVPASRISGLNLISEARDRTLAEPLRRAIAGETVHFESHYAATLSDVAGYYRFSFQPVHVEGEFAFVLAFADDISERHAAEEHIEFLAHHDQLTGLPNRSVLRDRLTQAIAAAGRTRQRLALLFIDLDHFKDVNDTLGHSVGDQLLLAASARLATGLRESDTLARVGGDEFMLLLTHLHLPGDCARIAEKLVTALAAAFAIDTHTLNVSASIGIAIWPEDGDDAETLTRNADLAMYAAKARGRNRYQYFTSDLNARAEEILRIETALRQALHTNQLVLHYQAQYSAESGHIVGIEALVRWQHPEWGLVPPDRFIPIAEQRGLINAVGAWVLHEACRQIRAWRAAGVPTVPVAVNVSALQFRQGALAETVASVLGEDRDLARCLVLEITESAIIEDLDAALSLLDELRSLGIQIEIDDFGTGHSSLAALKRLPLHRLKIDRSFVRDITDDPDDAAIVRAIIAMAASLRLEVIAEGVETPAQRDFLRDNGCTLMQGYHFARPEPAAEITVRLQGTPVSLAPPSRQ